MGTRLPGQQRERLFRGLQVCSALVMLHQVAGKAVRAGYYLGSFGPSRLPEMVAAAAVFSLLLSYLGARLFTRFSPARALPFAFLVSSALQIGEWLLLPGQPKIAAVLVYLHMFGLGAVLFSAFWSLLSEEFDPREAKRKIGRIAAAGTAGGLAGGVLAERIVAWFNAGSVMLLLSLVHLACGLVLYNVFKDSPGAKEHRARTKPAPSPAPPVENSHYLRTLGALVLLGAVSAALIDFAFNYRANATIESSDLVGFFGLFYTGVSLLTLLLQSAVSGKALEFLGLGKTMATLPATAAAGSGLALLFPGFSFLTAVRGAEASLRSSLFRSGYEVCFTPLPAAGKRRVKTLIDVGAERGGDLAGSAIAMLIIRLAAVRPVPWILSAAGVLAAGSLIVTRLVDKAYVKALARSLMTRGAELDLTGSLDLTTRTVLSHSGPYGAPQARPAAEPAGQSVPSIRVEDPVLLQLAALRSTDAGEVREALKTADATHPMVAAQLISLLGSGDFGADALARLQTVAERWVGLLCDHLAGAGQDYQVRRKIPALLAGVPTRRAFDGLLAGLSDERFEVRCQCSRALFRLKRAKPELHIERELLLATVDRELSAGMIFGEGQRMIDLDAQVWGVEGLDVFLKERAHVGLQHVFTLLALEYPQEPLLMAFRALQVNDRHLHGTALEYLDSVLPAKTRQLLWQVVGERPATEEPRQAQEVLEDLMKASATVVLKLKSTE